MDKYLQGIPADVDNPGLLVTWNWNGIGLFVNAANAANGLPQPNIPIRNIGALTEHSFMEDMLTYFRRHTTIDRVFQPIRYSDVLFAPNDQIQYSKLLGAIGRFSGDPFIATVIQQNQHIKLASLAMLADKTIAKATAFSLNDVQVALSQINNVNNN